MTIPPTSPHRRGIGSGRGETRVEMTGGTAGTASPRSPLTDEIAVRMMAAIAEDLS